MEKLIALAKRRGFIYQGSEIYGGLAGTYDYGPLGTALKNNIKNLWWKMFVDGRDDMYGMDAAVLMNGRRPATLPGSLTLLWSVPSARSDSARIRFRTAPSVLNVVARLVPSANST